MPAHTQLYSEEDYERLALVISEKTGRSLVDPRFTADHIRELIEGYVYREQYWLDRKLQLQHTKQHRILFGISDDPKRAAWTTETIEKPEGFIVLSLHTLFKITTYFNLVMSHPQLLTEWGTPSTEQWPRPQVEGELNFAPLDPERRIICRLLQRMALRFVIAHELTHILHGHIRIKSAMSSNYCLDETPQPFSEKDALESQTLEIDADIGAIPECFGDASIWIETFNDGLARDWLDGTDLLLTHEKRAKLWSFAIYSLFRIMADGQPQVSLRFASHPRPMFRVMNFFLHLDERLQRTGNEDVRERLAKAFACSIQDGKKVFRELGINPMVPDSPDDLLFGSFDTYPSSINQKWFEFRPQLESVSTAAFELPQNLISVENIKTDRLVYHMGLKQQS